MSYFRAKALQNAKQFTAEYAAEQTALHEREMMRSVQLMNASRAWLEEYRTRTQRPSRFNWSPRWPFSPPEESHGTKISEENSAVHQDG